MGCTHSHKEYTRTSPTNTESEAESEQQSDVKENITRRKSMSVKTKELLVGVLNRSRKRETILMVS